MKIMPEQSLQRLMKVMEKLRNPEDGCPWDNEQTWHSLIEHTLEEAYEVADAIERFDVDQEFNTNCDVSNVKEELGDLLFQVVFYARIAEEQQLFNLPDVIQQLCDKLELRHPHVFSNVDYSRDQLDLAWHEAKKKQRQSKKQHSVLDDVPLALPALTRAQKLTNRASKEGFDWRTIEPVFEKLEEEILELKEAMLENNQTHIEEELGDVLFTTVSLARHLKLDSETALRRSSRKFEHRYRKVEQFYNQQEQSIADASSAELEACWDSIKQPK